MQKITLYAGIVTFIIAIIIISITLLYQQDMLPDILNIQPSETFEETAPLQQVKYNTISFNDKSIHWIPLEYLDKPYVFGPIYKAPARYLGDESGVIFEVILGAKDSNILAGECTYDETTNIFTEMRWFQKNADEFVQSIHRGVKGQIRFYIDKPHLDEHQKHSASIIQSLRELIADINTNQSSVVHVLSPTEYCVTQL
ncbi:hypothetical protein ACFL1P_01685 [Patescibacteria group bacterium]